MGEEKHCNAIATLFTGRLNIESMPNQYLTNIIERKKKEIGPRFSLNWMMGWLLILNTSKFHLAQLRKYQLMAEKVCCQWR